MKNNKTSSLTGLVLACCGLVLFLAAGCAKESDKEMKEVRPFTGEIRLTVSTTGTVMPQNRLELKPSVTGRIEEIRVREGDRVTRGRVLAIMSSVDRAALIDAARLQGPDALKYWQEAYKPIPVIAPIDGTIIVRSIEPGQTVTGSDVILVISDRLIVKAQVDETDIGRVREGQRAVISLDAHPEKPVMGKVTHIYYESATVNNVTVYNVVITPDTVPPEFRSGMSAGIEITEKEKDGALLLSQEALLLEGESAFVLVKKKGSREPDKRPVTTGLSDDRYIEITGGLDSSATVLIPQRDYIPQEPSKATNPFMPRRPGAGRK